MPSLRISLSIKSFVSGVRAFFSAYKKRVIAAGGVIQNEPCAIETLKTIPLSSASWTLVPSGIEEDIVFAQKPTSGLGDLTFTRASDATYTDSTGVVRRSPYNLLQFSEQFDNGVWGKLSGSTVTANQATAPNGTLTADLITEGTSVLVYFALNIFRAGTYTQSYYAKKGTGDIFGMYFGSGFTARFNLTSGTIVSTNNTTATIQSVGDGWYRCTATATPTSDFYAGIFYANAIGLTVFAWGAQLVEGTQPLDYFPTTNRQDVPRIDFRNADGTLSSCGRLLLEPQRTNGIRNSSMVGAVAGSPGTLPTNWTATNGGLTQTITGIGTENGLPYIDLRYNGTATASSFDINFDAITQIAASNGQVWTASAYLKQVSNPNPVNSISYLIFEYTSAGVFLAAGALTLSVTSSLERFPFTRTLNGGATVGAVRSFFRFNLTNGAAYDFTIRIAAPQMELGAYATTWVPTTTAAVTRTVDSFTRNNIYTNGLISAAGGTWFIDFSNNVATARDSVSGIYIGDAVANTGNQFIIRAATVGKIIIMKYISSVSTTIFTSTTNSVKIAIKWNGTSADLFVNGIKEVSATPFTTTLMENFASGSPVPFYINQMLLAPTPLSDAECIQLTTL